jgi:hypothetical protein
MTNHDRGGKTVKRYIFILTVLIFLSACGNPTDIRFGVNPVEDLRKNEEVLKKLPAEDFSLLASYINFAEANKGKGQGHPATGKSVGETLQEAKSWQEAQSAAAAIERKRQEEESVRVAKLEAERKFRRDKVAGIVQISFVKRTVVPANPGGNPAEPMVVLEYDIENKGGKAISALKGRGVYRDLSGKTIIDYPFQTQKTVPVGAHIRIIQSYRIVPEGRDIANLANAEEGKFSFTFEPEVLILDGGEILSLVDKSAN